MVTLLGTSWLTRNLPWDAVFGGGSLIAFLAKAYDIWNSRPRFGCHPKIDARGHVVVDVVQKGKAKGYLQALKVVFVKPWVYQHLRAIRRSDPATGIPLATILDKPVEPILMSQFEPGSYDGDVPKTSMLPPPINPFGPNKSRGWKRYELRLSVATSTKVAHIRIGKQRGTFTPRAAEKFPAPDIDPGRIPAAPPSPSPHDPKEKPKPTERPDQAPPSE
jgi:hypothetical protein